MNSFDSGQRERLFDHVVEKGHTAASTLDFNALEPHIRETAARMIVSLGEAFMAEVGSDGIARIPESKVGSNGFAILPLVRSDEVVPGSRELLMPTPAQIQQVAKQIGMSPDRAAKVLQSTAKRILPRTTPLHSGRDTLGLMGVMERRVHTETYLGRVPSFPLVPVGIACRSIIIVNPEVLNEPDVVVGSGLLHECTHAQDKQDKTDMTDPRTALLAAAKAQARQLGRGGGEFGRLLRKEQRQKIENDREAAILNEYNRTATTDEARGFHVGYVAMGPEGRARHADHETVQLTAKVEAMRRLHTTPEEPFRLSQAGIDAFLDMGIIAEPLTD